MDEQGVAGSRCFVVCGKNVTGEELQAAFAPYGAVESVKVVRDKGVLRRGGTMSAQLLQPSVSSERAVAYVKYDKASQAALAIEDLNGAVLNDGRGPKLKVLLAEAPSARNAAPQPRQHPGAELSSDPDNVPPRSRLFLVVPKSADPQLLQDHVCGFPDLEYCKTDLVATKGVAFCKFSKSSSALKALEAIADDGMLAGYRVKVMLAEPKTKRVRTDMSQQDIMYQMHQAAKLGYDMGNLDNFKLQMGSGIAGGHLSEYSSLPGLSGLAGNLNNFNAALASNMSSLAADMHLNTPGLNFSGSGELRAMSASASPMSPNNMSGMPLSKQRLFIVVHKGVPEEMLARLFRRFPGMEYCDLKKDRATGRSKGYCYVNYSSPESAMAAVAHLNGIEFPAHTGNRIKVMFAEPLGIRNTPGSSTSTHDTASTPAGSLGMQLPYKQQTYQSPPSHMSPNTSGGGGGGGVPGMGSRPLLSMRSPGGLSMHASSASSAHTPLSCSAMGLPPLVTPDTLASVGESLAAMSVHHSSAAPHSSGGGGPGRGDGERGGHGPAARGSSSPPRLPGQCCPRADVWGPLKRRGSRATAVRASGPGTTYVQGRVQLSACGLDQRQGSWCGLPTGSLGGTAALICLGHAMQVNQLQPKVCSSCLIPSPSSSSSSSNSSSRFRIRVITGWSQQFVMQVQDLAGNMRFSLHA
ncbi:hypothetical protein QJQ45_029346 [Haematococcus lacustris]|nr:hypothetical protein QJQ45_029346 [Haematococcus lacustris]